MRSFFKIFFASFLSLIIFALLCLFVLIGLIGSLASKSKPSIAAKSVLVIDLSKTFHERMEKDPLNALNDEGDLPGLFDVVRLIEHAKNDKDIAGIYLEAGGNANGFASSNELRNELIEFRKSKKFVLAYADIMDQGSYFVASAADRVYVNPSGSFDWKGYAISFAFVKELLDKLEVRPQIFYAGKFKSATEMFRTTEMTPENRLQTTEWLNDLYRYFLVQTAASRNLDTATLYRLASTASIQTPQDAVNARLIDAVKYDDELKAELKQRLNLGRYDKLNLVSINKYNEAASYRKTGSDKIAVVYAEGNIVDGAGSNDNIGGDHYVDLLRKLRMDKAVKAIVLRVNSGGGSALASEKIWRELKMARQEGKPVVASFGDVAASGGYYIASGADSIFASPNTITGSIGVFSVLPEMGSFFKNKLGITFDGVKTAPYADAGVIYRPLNETERAQVQASVDRIYLQFKQRVSEGRKKDIGYIDSIAQGRVWSGNDAMALGLVDRIGNLQTAIDCAKRLAKLSDPGIREYPENGSWLDNFLQKKKDEPVAQMKAQLGEEGYRLFLRLKAIREMTESVQARLPFEYEVH